MVLPYTKSVKYQPVLPPPHIAVQACRSTNHINIQRFAKRRPLGQFRSPQVLRNQFSDQLFSFLKIDQKSDFGRGRFFLPPRYSALMAALAASPLWFGWIVCLVLQKSKYNFCTASFVYEKRIPNTKSTRSHGPLKDSNNPRFRITLEPTALRVT